MVENSEAGKPGMDRGAIGNRGEEVAAAYLVKQGYALLARNWRIRGGELDIIGRDGDCLVFIEVRTRTTHGPSDPSRDDSSDRRPFTAPEDSVTRGKQRRLAAMAEAYVYKRGWSGPWRIDVIAIELRPDGQVASLRHIQDAVMGR